MSIRSSVNHKKHILLVFFHQVIFPGKFFNFIGVRDQFLGKDGIFFDLIEIEVPLLLQTVQLFLILHPVQNAAAVEEYHPHRECNEGNRVFVKYYAENFLKHFFN